MFSLFPGRLQGYKLTLAILMGPPINPEPMTAIFLQGILAQCVFRGMDGDSDGLLAQLQRRSVVL